VAWDEGFAYDVKARIDAGQGVEPEVLSRFLAMVNEAVDGQRQQPGP
jgi:hypothetical protein